MTNYPTAWQRRVLWSVATALAIIALGAVAVMLLVLLGRGVGFLQPVLIPFAVAAVLAFLLDPVVRVLSTRTRLSRTMSVMVVFVVMALLLALLFVSVVPQIYGQSVRMVEQAPAYTLLAQKRLVDLLDATEKKINQVDHALHGSKSLPGLFSPAASPSPESPASPSASPDASATPSTPASPDAAGSPAPDSSPAPAAPPNALRKYFTQQLPAFGQQVPAILNSGWHVVIGSIGGFMGVFGALLSAVIIPVYLWFLLVEGRNIARWWSEYLPIRDSPFKQEVVSVLLEINGYLTAFFRGQLIVSTIDGLLIGGSVYLFVGLDGSFFVGLMVVVLTFIPYLGIILCYIPAVLIAIIQFFDWQHPLYVVLIMFIVQTLESTIISPKIVGDSVGLHPLTVIISVFGWSLLLNGPIGAILAVPLSATIKVLLRRYVWEKSGRGRHFVPLNAASVATLQQVALETEYAKIRAAAESGAPALQPLPPHPAAATAAAPPADP